MGRRAQVQFPAILARRQDTPDRTQSIGQGNVETTTLGTLVRLCSARRWSYQVFARTRLFHHQHRRHSPLGGSLVGTGHAAEKFVYLSSLSVYGAIKEGQPYEEITEQDTPRPNTAYGQSKLEAERLLESYGTRLPYVILRPTGCMVQGSATIISWQSLSSDTWISP